MLLLILLSLSVLNSATMFSHSMASPVYEVAMSSQGKSFAVRTLDDRVYFFNSGGATILEKSYPRNVKVIAVSDGGSYLGVGNIDGNLRIYKESEDVFNLKADNAISGLAISNNGEIIAYSSDKELGIISFLKPFTQINLGNYIYSVGISRDGSEIAAGLSNGSLIILNQKGKIVKNIDLGNLIYEVEVSEDGSTILARTTKRIVILTSSGDIVFQKELKVRDACLAGKAERFGVVSDNIVEIYDFYGHLLYKIKAEGVQSIDTNEDSNLLLVGTWGGDVKLLNLSALILNKSENMNISANQTEIAASQKTGGIKNETPVKVIKEIEGIKEYKMGHFTFKELLVAFLVGVIISSMTLIYFKTKK